MEEERELSKSSNICLLLASDLAGCALSNLSSTSSCLFHWCRLYIAVSVALNAEFCSSWNPVTAIVADELLPKSLSPVTPLAWAACYPPFRHLLIYLPATVLSIFHSLQSALKAILPATFVVLDCGVREKMSAQEMCLHFERKQFLQLYSHKTVAKPLRGSTGN